ncbi:helix-turn-helix transcriptional regulator [Deinococcus cellulosilyticus]|uniref:HTH luxR-type domain-containing protein n=1 Tax=Deinococcus cellulosilyticus (strain DSM 18568 / NBRC 106333 / KACC 11606 / 5516J-15) TaxID=1223518 RepID=A0A511MWD6_DEIC1|nr:helix-turn-helix transcriptional regulator [Deinococcus cellulosilyticus]GEM44578.1 hypothetical protein DC3_02130 [Deinococcus cellulosilyticus NBRC 106333 = KACC 11606]
MPRNNLPRHELLNRLSQRQAIQVLHAPAGYGKTAVLKAFQILHPAALCLDDADRMDPQVLEHQVLGWPAEQSVLLAARNFPYTALRRVTYQRDVQVWSSEELAFSEAEALEWGLQSGFAPEDVLDAQQKWMGWIHPMHLDLQGSRLMLHEFLEQEVLPGKQGLAELAPLSEITPEMAGYLLGREQAQRIKNSSWVLQRLFRGTEEHWRWVPGLRDHLLLLQAFQHTSPAYLQDILNLLLDDHKYHEALTLVQQHFTSEGALLWLHTHLQDLLLAGCSEQIHEVFHELLGQPCSGTLEARRILIRSYMAFFGGTPYRASLGELKGVLCLTSEEQLQSEAHALLSWWTPDPEQATLSRAEALKLADHRHFFRHLAQVGLGREKTLREDFAVVDAYFRELLGQTLQAGLVCESLLTLLMQAQGQVHHLKLRLAEQTLRQLFDLGSQHPDRCRPLVAHARALHAQLCLLALRPEEAVQSAQQARRWAEKTYHAHLLQQSADALLLGQHFLNDAVAALPETSPSIQAQVRLLQGHPLQALELLSGAASFMGGVLQVRCRLDLGDHLRASEALRQLGAGSATEQVYLQATKVDVLMRLKKLSEARLAARSFWQTVQFEPIYLPLVGLSEGALLLLFREARKQGIQPAVALDTLRVAPPLLDLSDRERTMLQFLSAGQSNQQMAEALGISVNTVKYHLKHLYEKLGVSSREAARDLGQRVISGW